MGVGADRVDGPEALLPQVGHGDDPPVHLEPASLPLWDVSGGRYLHQRHDAHDSFASSSSMARCSPVRTSSSSTRSRTSWKNPNTMRRSASCREMPRVWR